jgi:hypothetical protein
MTPAESAAEARFPDSEFSQPAAVRAFREVFAGAYVQGEGSVSVDAAEQLAGEAFPENGYAHPATLLAFRTAFVDGFTAGHASRSRLRPAPPATTASNYYQRAMALVEEDPTITGLHEILDPVPVEQVEYLASHFDATTLVVAPVLVPGMFRVEPHTTEIGCTQSQLDAVRAGDVVLAERLAITGGRAVHSIGSVTVTKSTPQSVVSREGEPTLVYRVEQRAGVGSFGEFDTVDEATTAAIDRAERTPGMQLFVRAHLKVEGSTDLVAVTSSSVRVCVDLAVVSYDEDAPIAGFYLLRGTKPAA